MRIMTMTAPFQASLVLRSTYYPLIYNLELTHNWSYSIKPPAGVLRNYVADILRRDPLIISLISEPEYINVMIYVQADVSQVII